MHHYSVIELIESEEDLEREQDILDQQDDTVSELGVRVKKLISVCSSSSTSPSSPANLQLRKLRRLENDLGSIRDSITSLDESVDNTCRLQLYQEQLSDFKRELVEIRDTLLSIGVADTEDLMRTHDHLERGIFDSSLRIRELLHVRKNAISSTAINGKGVKLPKLDVPTFSGDILSWQTFWEQFNVSVHERSHLSEAEKLVYLRQALKDGSAKNTIEGLSRSGEQYHVRKIIDAPSLRDGNGKELRKFHDTMQQHIRALKAMGHEPPGSFLTSLLELKLDVGTTFEWQKHSQSSTGIPPFQDLLDFVNLRAQASETALGDPVRRLYKNEVKPTRKSSPVQSFAADVSAHQCIVCKDKHPLYVCAKFKTLSHDQKLSTIREHRLCWNCFGGNHLTKNCKSNYRCKRCQKPHHTLLHNEVAENQPSSATSTSDMEPNSVTSNAATGLNVDTLMMTCQVVVSNQDGASVEARALLDSASSASFVSKRLAQSLHLPQTSHCARISGITGLSHGSPIQSVTTFSISAVKSTPQKFCVTAIVVPRVTCELPHHPISFDLSWNHLSNIELADPHFGQPGKIDILLGVDIFVQVLRNGRRAGPPGSPAAFETEFGWVLAGEINPSVPCNHIASHHVFLETGDDLLRKFWEIEQQPLGETDLSIEENTDFQATYSRASDGRFIVPLPRKTDAKTLGESRSQAVRRFVGLERSLRAKSQFDDVDAVIQEYIELGHAELVPELDLHKPTSEVFYLPIHVVRKESSSTTKIRAVFDASAKSSSGISLNDTFLVGPTCR